MASFAVHVLTAGTGGILFVSPLLEPSILKAWLVDPLEKASLEGNESFWNVQQEPVAYIHMKRRIRLR